jgi:hypothetical protein
VLRRRVAPSHQQGRRYDLHFVSHFVMSSWP